MLSSTAGAAEWMLAFSVPFLFCTSVKLAGLSEGGLCTRKAADLPPGFFAWGKEAGEVQSAHRHQALTAGYNAVGQQIPFFLCPRQCFMGTGKAGNRANFVHPIPLSTFPKLHRLPLFQYLFLRITNMTCKMHKRPFHLYWCS